MLLLALLLPKKSSWIALLIWIGHKAVIQVTAFSSTSEKRSSVVATAVIANNAVPNLKNGMDYVNLGTSDLLVSKVCMGTMMFGNQVMVDEGVKQLNTAWDEYGINFLDTAEMYPVPSKSETTGKTDETVAAFLKGRKREDVILATKVSGRSERVTWLRKDGSTTRVNRAQILESVEASLKRLGTDYIDLLQIHWPDRYVGGMFGSPDFSPSKLWDSTPFEEQLSTMKELIDAGKVRHIGVSNETPFGVCSMVELANRHPELYAKIVSIQNSYSLVVRKDFEAGLSECCFMHKVGLLAYSPLSAGVLTGKYQNPEKVPDNARLKMFPG